MEQRSNKNIREFIRGLYMTMMNTSHGVCCRVTVDMTQLNNEFIKHTKDGKYLSVFFYPYNEIRKGNNTHYCFLDDGRTLLTQHQTRELHPTDKNGAHNKKEDPDYFDDEEVYTKPNL